MPLVKKTAPSVTYPIRYASSVVLAIFISQTSFASTPMRQEVVRLFLSSFRRSSVEPFLRRAYAALASVFWT